MNEINHPLPIGTFIKIRRISYLAQIISGTAPPHYYVVRYMDVSETETAVAFADVEGVCDPPTYCMGDVVGVLDDDGERRLTRRVREMFAHKSAVLYHVGWHRLVRACEMYLLCKK